MFGWKDGSVSAEGEVFPIVGCVASAQVTASIVVTPGSVTV